MEIFEYDFWSDFGKEIGIVFGRNPASFSEGIWHRFWKKSGIIFGKIQVSFSEEFREF